MSMDKRDVEIVIGMFESVSKAIEHLENAMKSTGDTDVLRCEAVRKNLQREINVVKDAIRMHERG